MLKADGLAAGKGVVVAPDRETALAAVEAMMVERRFGAAGARIVVEEYLEGREASFFVLTDGTRVVTLPSAEDHKRAFDGDHGPNTGGMGAFAPSPLIDEAVGRRVLDEIVLPTLDGMRAEGREYRGFLYVGLDDHPRRPEGRGVQRPAGRPRDAGRAAVDRRPAPAAVRERGAWAARGGPRPDAAPTRWWASCSPRAATRTTTRRANRSRDLTRPRRVPARWSSTPAPRVRDGRVVTAGGRVLTVVGRGTTLGDAIGAAYGAAARISFEGLSMRRDIGVKALEAR